MTSNPYKLSSTVFGHTSDVRCLAVTQNSEIISGSRDLTAKLWEIESTGQYMQKASFTCHSNFVSSVCYLPPSAQRPNGVIVTGSNDKQIRLFDPSETAPFKVLDSHTNTVCKVIPAIFGWTFLTSSWDLTARAWREENGEWLSTVFSGHTAAVWTVCQLPLGLVVTGSADKTLRVYGESGDFQRVLTGHTDCVRDVVTAGSEEVLSVSNDATVRHWNVISAVCLNTYYGHGHYIYSISMLPGIGWVTCSEDRTVKVWGPSGELDSVSLPCASIWAVSVLPNSDIVTGSNDGAIRIFTQERARIADATTLAEYEQQVSKICNDASQEVGGVKLSELPGLEALSTPGKTNGQTKLVRVGNKAVAFGWSAENGTWEEIGDVVGSGAASSSDNSRPVYNGQEYDYVFNVDIEEGKPPLKLPYNKNVDPWIAAQKFIHDEDLPQSYLEQVANFIISNSEQKTSIIQSDFVDPFTGCSRYVPQSGNSDAVRNVQQSSQSRSNESRYFPQREFLRFEQANLSVIEDKINILIKDHDLGVSKDEIDNFFSNLIGTGFTNVNVLKRMLQWPIDQVFPVLDILRIVILDSKNSQQLCSDELLTALQPQLQMHPNNLMVLRICCNMMSTSIGEELASKHRLKLIEFILSIPPPTSKFLQVALATLLLNISVMLRRSVTPDGRNEALLASRELFPGLEQEEAVFRGLVAVGTLLHDSQNPKQMGEHFLPMLNKYSASSIQRIHDCAKDILSILVN